MTVQAATHALYDDASPVRPQRPVEGLRLFGGRLRAGLGRTAPCEPAGEAELFAGRTPPQADRTNRPDRPDGANRQDGIVEHSV